MFRHIRHWSLPISREIDKAGRTRRIIVTIAIGFLAVQPNHSAAQHATVPSTDNRMVEDDFRPLRPQSPESYVDLATIWKDRWPIPVCWETADKPYAREKKWVEDAIRTIVERTTAVRFSGYRLEGQRWSKCAADTLGIRIAIADRRPRSEVGQRWTKDEGTGKRELPTRMTLNFKMGGAYESYCRTRMRHCIAVTSVHEFLHAIGFLHEHLREDAPEECRQRFGHEEDIVGERPKRFSPSYDKRSIMNYCESIFREPVRLSDDDVEAVNYFYNHG